MPRCPAAWAATSSAASWTTRPPSAIQAVGDDEPYTGEILVTGAANSSVRIVINDSTSVTLEVDANGDSVIDQFIDTNWAALNGNTSTINASTAPVIAREVIHAVTGFGSMAITPGSQFVPTAPFGLVKLQAVSGDFGPMDVNCAARARRPCPARLPPPEPSARATC